MLTQMHLAAAYNRVGTWIVNGGAVNNGQETGTPYLFCYHNWLQKQTMRSPALDSAGETYPNLYTGTEMLLNQEQMYITRQQEETTALGNVNAVPVSPAILFLSLRQVFSIQDPLLIMCSGILVLESQAQGIYFR